MKIQSFFDAATATFTYVLVDELTRHCAVIDPVLDFDFFSGKTDLHSLEPVINYIETEKLQLEWILETHAHADHLSGAEFLKQKLGGKIAIGEHIIDVLKFWVPLFNNSANTPLDGSQFDRLLVEGEVLTLGTLKIKVMHTPGHTPACCTYVVEDAAFVGDTLFMPYVGTARTDFPGGSAAALYHSIQRILSLPDETRLFTCHDYPPEGQKEAYISTVAEQKKKNVMIHEGVSESEYVNLRHARDKGKAVPKLLLPSIQVNLRAGSLGPLENNGIRYIKIPLNRL
jgi:glyoxylase-like metal-dependent hydrolase (beta-lactamase superfamily II)